MDCERIEEMLPAFVERELAPKEGASVRAHVESCPRCREALQTFVAMEQSLATRRAEVPPFETFLPPALAPSRWHPSIFLRSLRALTSVPGVAIVLVMWVGFLVARYSDRLTGGMAEKTTLERMTAFAQRGIDAIVAAGGGDVWTLTAVYGALAIAVIVSAGALTMRLVRD
jgi:predicted anti-sigma-YlaC factor YlaD